MKIDGVKSYIRRSCKTDNAALAMRKATEDYENYKLRKQNNLSLENYTVAQYFERWIDSSTKTETRLLPGFPSLFPAAPGSQGTVL